MPSPTKPTPKKKTFVRIKNVRRTSTDYAADLVNDDSGALVISGRVRDIMRTAKQRGYEVVNGGELEMLLDRAR